MSEHSQQRPDPLRTDINAFAYDTMFERVPGIIRRVQAANADYPSSITHNLDRLHDALRNNDPISMLDSHPAPPPDYALWQAAHQSQRARIDPLMWQHSEWFFAETFLYRHLIQAVRWRETGRDPFAPIKQEELDSPRFRQLLNTALDADEDTEDRLARALSFVLWGNRVDLSHPAGNLADDMTSADDLLVDDRDALLDDLVEEQRSPAAQSGGAIHIVVDNAGTELAMDLMLADVLVAGSSTVVLHVKEHPTFVSDATVADVWHVIDAMAQVGDKPAALAQRLRRAWQQAQLVLATNHLWTSSRFLWEMPDMLRASLSPARLVILKGDMNYRRATGDAIWPENTPFSTAMQYFPAPVVALRTLKSDPIVGLPADRVRALDAQDAAWRTTGQYGLIQYAARAASV
jgi:hypothetical protein